MEEKTLLAVEGLKTHCFTRAGVVKAAASIKGEIGSALNLPTGCRFHPRCDLAEARCREAEPALIEIAPGHSVACHRVTG